MASRIRFSKAAKKRKRNVNPDEPQLADTSATLSDAVNRETVPLDPVSSKMDVSGASVDYTTAVEEGDADDAFDDGFQLFKPDANDYLDDTWGDISRKNLKKQKSETKIVPEGQKVADRLRLKEKKAPKRKDAKRASKTVEEDKSVQEEDGEVADGKDDLTSTIGFHEMNLSRPLLKAISEMNFTSPTPVQASAIPVALLGKDICACSRTGTGKTAAYMLPILERLHYKPKVDVATRVLVLVPTRELGAQVYSVTKELLKYLPVYIQVALAVGGLDMKKQERELRERPDIVIATPGRLLDHIQNTPSFGLNQVEILVLDEADRMLDEYFAEQMGEVIKMCSVTRQTMLFSATMTDEVQKLATVSLKDPVRLFVDESASVALALRQEFVRIRDEDTREAVLLALLCRSFPERTLVFIPTKVQVHRFQVILQLCKIKSAELHGNLSQLQRLAALEEFKEGRADILLATDVAARGLDIPFVKTVINLALPKTLEQYVHRVGRTARAGRVGRSVSLVGEGERKVLKLIVKNARLPVQNRIVPPEVVEIYQSKLGKMKKEIHDALNAEKADKELAQATLAISTAQDKLKGKKPRAPALVRPVIPGYNKGKSKKWRKGADPKKNKVKKDGRDPEDISLSKVQKGQAKKFKKDFKPKRTRACIDVPNFGQPKKAHGSKKKDKKKNKSSFAADLTDTRKKGVKRLNKIGGSHPKDKKFHKKGKR